MPPQWRAPRVSSFRPESAAQPSPSRRPLSRSRWALAASVGLLVLGSLCLPSRFTQDFKPADLLGTPISDTEMRKQMEKEHKIKEFEDRNKPGLGADEGEPPHDLDEFDLSPIK